MLNAFSTDSVTQQYDENVLKPLAAQLNTQPETSPVVYVDLWAKLQKMQASRGYYATKLSGDQQKIWQEPHTLINLFFADGTHMNVSGYGWLANSWLYEAGFDVCDSRTTWQSWLPPNDTNWNEDAYATSAAYGPALTYAAGSLTVDLGGQNGPRNAQLLPKLAANAAINNGGTNGPGAHLGDFYVAVQNTVTGQTWTSTNGVASATKMSFPVGSLADGTTLRVRVYAYDTVYNQQWAFGKTSVAATGASGAYSDAYTDFTFSGTGFAAG